MRVIWLQAAGCGGRTMSLLCAEDPNVPDLLSGAGIRLVWHPALSVETGAEARAILERAARGDDPLDVLCVEGSVARGPKGTGRCRILSGTGQPMLGWITRLAARAQHVVAVGSCAAYGGVTSAGGSPSDAVGLQYEDAHPGGAPPAGFRSNSGLPVINVAGCPTHPDWVTETLLMLAAGSLGPDGLDGYARPRLYADHLVHHACPKTEFCEYKASARNLSEIGCMVEHLGCVGTRAVDDCNIRPWNGNGSCTRGGYPPRRGAGMVEAARGALGHWLTIEKGRIACYQIIAPTTWNFSPRDAGDVPGALEAALVSAEGEATPLTVQHIVRSFDPCMVCTVH